MRTRDGRTRPNTQEIERLPARLMPRHGLRESLETFSNRLGCTLAQARLQWRALGLKALGVNLPVATLVQQLQPYVNDWRIMPGLAIKTRTRGYEERE